MDTESHTRRVRCRFDLCADGGYSFPSCPGLSRAPRACAVPDGANGQDTIRLARVGPVPEGRATRPTAGAGRTDGAAADIGGRRETKARMPTIQQLVRKGR